MDAAEHIKLTEVEDRMWYFRALHGHAHRLLEAGLNGIASPRVLDAGCGTGGLLARLHEKERAWRLAGIDFSALACGLAAKRCPMAEIREASITALPFDDGSFDAIASADVVSHVEDDTQALAEFFRCVRPGGVVVINVPAYQWLWSYHDEAVQSKRRYGRGELTQLLETTGFSGVRATYWNTLPFPLLVLKRKVFRSAGRKTSDVGLFPAPVEAVFRGAMTLERLWLRGVGRLPYGSSVLAVARRPR